MIKGDSSGESLQAAEKLIFKIKMMKFGIF